MDKSQLIAKITHLPYLLKEYTINRKMRKSGFDKKALTDERNFETKVLGWSLFGYTPQNVRKINKINPLFIVNQGQNSICTQAGATHHRMIEEGVELKVQSLTSYMQRNGMLGYKGLASIDAPNIALQKYGIEAGKTDVYGRSFEDISSRPLNAIEAAKHKISSRWNVSSRGDILKLIDEGKTVEVATDWYTGYNQSMGFSYPFIIDKKIGYCVGGHFYVICGYDLNYYKNRQVYVCLNSYGPDWADHGYFYIDMDFFDADNYGRRCTLGIASGIGKFLNKYDGKNVKKSNNPAIYRIESTKKRVFVSWADFLSYFGLVEGFTVLSSDEEVILDALESGANMDIKDSPCNQLMSYIKNADQKEELLKALTIINYNKKIGAPLTNNLE